MHLICAMNSQITFCLAINQLFFVTVSLATRVWLNAWLVVDIFWLIRVNYNFGQFSVASFTENSLVFAPAVSNRFFCTEQKQFHAPPDKSNLIVEEANSPRQ